MNSMESHNMDGNTTMSLSESANYHCLMFCLHAVSFSACRHSRHIWKCLLSDCDAQKSQTHTHTHKHTHSKHTHSAACLRRWGVCKLEHIYQNMNIPAYSLTGSINTTMTSLTLSLSVSPHLTHTHTRFPCL